MIKYIPAINILEGIFNLGQLASICVYQPAGWYTQNIIHLTLHTSHCKLYKLSTTETTHVHCTEHFDGSTIFFYKSDLKGHYHKSLKGKQFELFHQTISWAGLSYTSDSSSTKITRNINVGLYITQIDNFITLTNKYFLERPLSDGLGNLQIFYCQSKCLWEEENI